MKREFTKLVRALEKICPRSAIEIDMRQKTIHQIGKRNFAIPIVVKLFLLSFFFLAFVIVFPAVGGAITHQYRLDGISEDINVYFIVAGIVVWVLSVVLVFTRIRK